MRTPTAFAGLPPIAVQQREPAGISEPAALALGAVQAGAAICERAAREVRAGTGVRRKQDRSPVTTADYAIQALVSKRLPGALVAEESLRDFDRLALPVRERVAELADLHIDTVRSALARVGELGTAGEVWVLDPIDGTAGLLGGGSYAIGLARVLPSPGCASDVAALALPTRGIVLLVDEGEMHVCSCNSGDGELRQSQERTSSSDTLATCRWHFSPEKHTVAVTDLPRASPLCCGSLVKYGEVALGHSTAFIQALPKNRALSWDHLAGIAAVVASGGTVTDLAGGAIEYGSTMEQARDVSLLYVEAPGIVATARGVDHGTVCTLARNSLAAKAAEG
jgi:3'-phosphoadenosine 5'-phosphosulfate (PAPS) 3'-phosphatase